MSESRGEGQPEGSAQPSNSAQPSSGGQSSSGPSSSGQPKNNNGQPSLSSGSGNGQSGSGRQARPSDPVADFQRWLMKAGARSMANQVADQVRRTLRAERRASGDVWDTATNESPPNEPPECQWCPVCQAARAARTGGAAGLGAQLANAGGVLASVVGDAFSAFEQAMKAQDQNQNQNRTERSGPSRPGSGTSDHGDAGQ